MVKTAEYRDPRLGRLHGLVFYTHSSAERGLRAATDWKSKWIDEHS